MSNLNIIIHYITFSAVTMEVWKDKIALVTGASAGIGAAIVADLIEYGMIVVGVARRKAKLQELKEKLPKDAQFYPIQGDVSSESDITRVFDYIKQNFGGIHVLVNNAAVLHLGRILSSSTDSWREMLDLNVFGLTMCCREAINLMRETKIQRGHVININSIAGHGVPDRDDPMMNIYPATKNAVTALCDILRFELLALKSEIKVTSISPGYTKTEMFTSNPIDVDLLPMLQDRPCLYPKDISNAVISVLATPAHVNITELTVKPLGEPV